MFNPRFVFLALTFVFVLLLVFDWENINKENKLNTSLVVQATDNQYQKISNGLLEIYIDQTDGSIKEAFLAEKNERKGLYKTRLMSDDELLTFYFKTSVSGFSPEPYVLEELTPNSLVLVSEDSANNKLRKTFSLTDGYVLEIFDELELAVPSYGSISFFKTFYRNGQKSVDYGTSFSRDHLAFSTSEDAFKDESITFIKTKKEYLGHWVGHSQKHFVVSVFDKENMQKISMYPADSGGVYRFGFEEQVASSSGEYVNKTSVFLGPKQKEVLEGVAPHFKYNLDLGFVLDWGVSIVLLTVLFKLALSPLQIMQIKSMVQMRKLQPKLQEIQQTYKNDQQKLGMEMMSLYRKEKFNPAAGCLPLFAQLPIFIAMFWVTREAFEFRGESFLWIPDLAESDPLFIAPVLMGLMMYASQKMIPKPPQTQGMQAQIAQQMMVVFPPMITVIFLFMPAGVVIYSVVNMVLSIVPQVI